MDENDAKLNSSNDGRCSDWRQTLIDCLRIVVAIQCFGIAGRYLFSEFESESHIFEYLVFETGTAESLAQGLDDAGAYLCLAAGVLFTANLALKPNVLIAGNRKQPTLHWLEVFGAGLVVVWTVADALTHTARGGVYSELTIGEVAVRLASPIALILLCQFCKRVNSARTVVKWILTIAISVTFLVHGYKAIAHFGPFCDLILLTDMRLFQFEFSQAKAESALTIIGWVDIGLAIVLLFGRYKSVAIYMLIWGLVTSVSRMTAMGWPAWPESLMRAANWGAVLALLILWRWEACEDVDD